MLRLRVREHALKSGEPVIELVDEHQGDLIAWIYATERGVKIVSKYVEHRPDLITIDPLPPPAVHVNLRRVRPQMSENEF